MIENLIELDREIFIYLNSLGKREYDFFWLVMTNKILNFTIYFIFSIIYLSKTNLKRFSLLVFTILLMILLFELGLGLLYLLLIVFSMLLFSP